MEDDNDTQKYWVAFAAKPPALLSILGSGWIVFHVTRSPTKRKNTHHRFLVAMSLYDIVHSTWILVGTMAMPRDYPALATYGNSTTCTAQGFFLMLGGVVPIYNAFIGINAILLVRYNLNSGAMKKFERCTHVSVFLFALSGAITSVVTGSINPSGPFCWLKSLPEGCQIRNDCVRGKAADKIKWIYMFAFCIAGSFVVATVAMIVLYCTVYQTELSSAQYYLRQEDTHRRSKKVAQQAFLYLSAFFFTYIFSVVSRITEIVTGELHFEFASVGVIAYPLQGFFNFLVYQWSHKIHDFKRHSSNIWSFVRASATEARLSFTFSRRSFNRKDKSNDKFTHKVQNALSKIDDLNDDDLNDDDSLTEDDEAKIVDFERRLGKEHKLNELYDLSPQITHEQSDSGDLVEHNYNSPQSYVDDEEIVDLEVELRPGSRNDVDEVCIGNLSLESDRANASLSKDDEETLVESQRRHRPSKEKQQNTGLAQTIEGK